MTQKHNSALDHLTQEIWPLFKGWNSVERRKKLTQEEVLYLLEQQIPKPELMINLENWELVMHELLLNFKCQELLHELKLTTWEILQNIRGLWKTFQVLKNNVEFAIEKIKSWEKVSINIEPEDIIHPEFVSLLTNIPLEYRKMLMIEFIESEYVDESNESIWLIISRIKITQKLWYPIAIDDWYNEDLDHIDTNNRSYKNLNLFLENNICPDVIKIEWQVIQDLYSNSQSENTHVKQKSINEISKIKVAILELRQKIEKEYWKSISVIWEWIDSFEIGMFAQKEIGVEYWQWRNLNQKDFQK
jgi:hypothetical protein